MPCGVAGGPDQPVLGRDPFEPEGDLPRQHPAAAPGGTELPGTASRQRPSVFRPGGCHPDPPHPSGPGGDLGSRGRVRGSLPVVLFVHLHGGDWPLRRLPRPRTTSRVPTVRICRTRWPTPSTWRPSRRPLRHVRQQTGGNHAEGVPEPSACNYRERRCPTAALLSVVHASMVQEPEPPRRRMGSGSLHPRIAWVLI